MKYNQKTIPLAPIFTPTSEEFADFKKYVYKLSERKDVKKAGCAKVE